MSELMPMQNPVTKIEPEIAARLAKQSYHLVGEHGGVKVCHWTNKVLSQIDLATKEHFTGLKVMAVCKWLQNVDTCNLACTYCWREPSFRCSNKD